MSLFSFGILRPKPKRRPHVLFVAVDDLNCRLGCYGDALAKSPNIDKIAERGVVFAKAFCQYPLCAPSRSSLLTGLRPDTTRVFDNRTHFRSKLPSAVSLPQLFRKSGYFTVSVGKVFHGGLDDPMAWDEVLTPKGLGRIAGVVRPGRPPRPLRITDWQATSCPDEREPDGMIALRAVRFIERYTGEKPLFLAVGFLKPHLPLRAPRHYFELYSLDEIEVPKMPPDDWSDIPKVALGYGILRSGPYKGLSESECKEVIRAYYACVSFIDAQFGKILEAMQRRKFLENCVIVVWGDNGFLLGEHGIWGKMLLFEESVRVPLIISAPDLPSKGVVCERLVELVDVYPTLAELCGLKPPSNLEGLSMVPLLERPSRPWKKGAFTQVKRGKVMGRSVRTERFRYTEWGGPDVAELYDHECDPHEFTNLADSPEYADVKRRLSQLLRKGWRAALP